MSRISGKGTKPEIILRKALFAKGFRYRVNVGNLPGKPDIVLPKYKSVIFDAWLFLAWTLGMQARIRTQKQYGVLDQ